MSVKRHVSFRGYAYVCIRRLCLFREWEKNYHLAKTELNALEAVFLERILQHARENVPYYRDLSLSDASLDQYPILTKEIIKERFEDLTSLKRDKASTWFENSSGGSTGKPQSFIQHASFVQWSMAALGYFFRDMRGIEYATVPKVVFWGSERDIFKQRESIKAKVANFLTQTYFINSFRMSDEQMHDAVVLVKQVQPVFIKGYASSLYAFACFVRDNNLKLPAPEFIYSSAESLRPFMRKVIEEVLGARVYDFYGSREVGAIAGECEQGNMHIFSFHNKIEVVDEQNQPVDVGEEGRVLVTNLHNTAMPLIRYDIGDRAVRGDDCACGNPLPVLTSVSGRVTDNFLNAKSEIVHGEYFTHLFYHRPWVKEFQILQTAINELHVYYCSDDQVVPEEDKDEINAKIRLVMGEECLIFWEHVDEVPRTPQGKLLFTRSLVIH